MLGDWRSHSEYQSSIESMLSNTAPEDYPKVQFYRECIEKLYILNLDPAKKVLESLYPPRGRPALFQPEIIRALIVMEDLKIDGIPELVERLRGDRFLASICGFDPNDIPGVGTFYDFSNRVWLEDPKKFRDRKLRVRKVYRKPKEAPKGGEKLPPKHPGIVKRLVDRFMEGRPFPTPPERKLQELLARCVVDESVKMGLLGDPQNLTIAGDGTCVESYANQYGIKTCNCKEKGIYRCDCARRYADPDARIGWDSFEKRWFFGYTFYVITAASSYHDLPMLLRAAEAQRHDSVIAPIALSDFQMLYPDLRIKYLLLDSAHDALPIYKLAYHLGACPIIDLNKRGEGSVTLPGPIDITELGIPICKGGLQMIPWGYCKSRDRIKWRCPHAVGVATCPLPKRCSPSPYGRTIYTRPSQDLRLICPIPRGTEAWNKLYDRRTSIERTNKRILIDYGLGRIRFLSKKQAFLRATAMAMNVHLDAQIKYKQEELDALFSKCMSKAA